MPVWEMVRNASFRTLSRRIAKAMIFTSTRVRNSPASQLSETIS